MNIKDITKMTREEFVEILEMTEGLNINTMMLPWKLMCPGDIGLKQNCIRNSCACKKCWLEAIKDVKFKNE